MWKEENLNDVVIKIGELSGVEIHEEDISVCHRLPMNRSHDGRPKQQKIIAKFVRREVKEKFYQSRKHLLDKTMKDLGYEVENEKVLQKITKLCFAFA